MSYHISTGKPHPLGATVTESGVNFSLFSEHATGVELLLFVHPHNIEPSLSLKLDPEIHRSYAFWHVFVEGLKPGAGYAYRVSGPWEPEFGHRFDESKVLIDPYAKANTHALWNRELAQRAKGDNIATSLRSIVIGATDFDWEDDTPLCIPKQQSIIYETHLAGFTKSHTSNVSSPGTYKGLIEKIPYLKELGITAVELLPIHEFDDTEVLRTLDDGSHLKNYWGYSPISFFALHPGYSSSIDPHEQLDEFRTMVKELHKAGIEVILDMVFNHTSEGDHNGPMINFRGIDNKIYYHLNPKDPAQYVNYSGCGNTLNCNHPIVSKMILESMEYWVKEMHVDGFRLDEGSVLSRNQFGTPEPYPRILWAIELSEVLGDTKLFTEAWDAAGLYEVGSFPGYRWSEWNGKYRDAVRRFVRGDMGMVGEIANRIAGSADLYERANEKPINSLNFITCHDGFTLKDLVSYNEKHNEANGEHNRDGINENYSCNYGVEGETEEIAVNRVRIKQLKNLFTILLLSQGVPMFYHGDEVGKSHSGNNNPYCQDNELTWFDWSLVEKNQELLEYVRHLISFRKKHGVFQRKSYFTGKKNKRGLYDIEWNGCLIHQPGWNDGNSRVLSMTLGADGDDADIFVAMNMDESKLYFEIPKPDGREWYLVAQTNKGRGDDFYEEAKRVYNPKVEVAAKTILVLESR